MKPQSIRTFGAACLLLTGSFLFTSCKKGVDGGKNKDNSISAVLKNHPELSSLATALQRTGLDTILAQKGRNYTIFAPNNDAFSAAGISAAKISSMDINQLNRLVKYHVLEKQMSALEFPMPSDTVKSMADTLNLFMSRNPNGTFVNGEMVVSTDIHADNGSIHVISGVLIPPTKTLAQVVIETPRFSLVYAALAKSGFMSRVTDRAKFSFFVPDDAAMNAAGWNSAKIDASTPLEVTDLLKHHVTITNTFSSDFYDNSVIYSFQAGTILQIFKSPLGLKLQGSVATPSKIVNTTRGSTYDVVTTNGVLHEIDKVIL